MTKLTKAQQVSLLRVYKRTDINKTYLQFRRSVVSNWDCVMVHWCGMWLGIEKDGYTHS